MTVVFVWFLLCLVFAPGMVKADAPLPLPSPWQSADIGAGTLPGASSFQNGSFTITGAGSDVQNTSDGFRYVYQPMHGDMVVTARVASQTNTDPWAKAGVMIREGLDADAKNAFLAVTPGNGVTFQSRGSAGGATQTEQEPEIAAPIWLRLRRVGSSMTAFHSADGKSWSLVGLPRMVPLSATVFVGLAMTSHQEGTLGQAILDQVTVEAQKSQPADPRDLSVTVSAVEPGIFHLVAYRKGNAPPPVSPYVVETEGTIVPGQVQTAQGTLTVSRDNGIRLRDKTGHDLLPSGTIGLAGDAIILTLTHDAHERFYGAGNESENHAGDLTHPSGTQVVNNGTRASLSSGPPADGARSSPTTRPGLRGTRTREH